VRRPLVGLAVVALALVVSGVLVVLLVVASDQDARADEGLSGVVCAPPGPPGAAVAGFGGTQLVNAGLVVAVGKECGCRSGGGWWRWRPRWPSHT
jgi:hypothetical protein